MDYTTSWAQLDQSNSQHYGRGYPLAIHTSGEALLKAAELHTNTVDLYERGACDIEEMHEAYEVYRIISAYRDRIYRRWMNGTLAVDRLEQLKQDIADQMDVDMMRTP